MQLILKDIIPENTDKMKYILSCCKDGEQFPANNKSQFYKEWELGKLLSYGVTSNGFPFVVFETTNMGHIIVGFNRDNKAPISKFRNDARAAIRLNTLQERLFTAERMTKELVY